MVPDVVLHDFSADISERAIKLCAVQIQPQRISAKQRQLDGDLLCFRESFDELVSTT